MKIVILRKSNQLGTTANIMVKGMSMMRYNFIWDRDIKHYAYEPKNQKEVDDIFLTQGKLYRHMYFSVVMDTVQDEPEIPEARLVKEGMIKQSLAEAEVASTKPKAKGRNKQPVEKELEPA